MELDLDVIKRLGKKREKENIEFRSFLKGQEMEEIDEIVHRLHDEIVEQIDCTQCGNCCNSLRPALTDEEIERLSGIDNVSPEFYEKKYLSISDDEIKYLKDIPCKYLKNKKCTIYPHRPEECRSYPYTHKDEFNTRLLNIINNYEICPIVFNLFERLKIELSFRY